MEGDPDGLRDAWKARLNRLSPSIDMQSHAVILKKKNINKNKKYMKCMVK